MQKILKKGIFKGVREHGFLILVIEGAEVQINEGRMRPAT